jgi:phosphatidylserine/phosphatidylglycerophosphate/cardiolipin synthase-like enzyme
MIIDDNTVITGSFNFTKAAEEKNAENVIVLKDNPALAQRYAQNWRAHAKHSVAYTGPRVHQADSARSKPQSGNAGFHDLEGYWEKWVNGCIGVLPMMSVEIRGVR